nr:hypothetical protein [Hassalia byssoidea]
MLLSRTFVVYHKKFSAIANSISDFLDSVKIHPISVFLDALTTST